MSDISSGQPATESDATAAPSTVQESNTVPAAPETAQTQVPENNANGQANAEPLTEEESKYLKSQNLDLAKFGIDSSNHEAVDNFINLHKSMRQTKSQTQQSQAPATPADVLGQSQTQTTPSVQQPVAQPQATAPQPAPVQTSAHGPSQLDIINMKTYLDANYPEVKDQLGTKEFYDGMRSFGFSPVNSNGEFNVANIMRYADILNTKAENTRLKQQSNRVNPGLIPDTDDRIDVTQSSLQVNNMTMNTAENIVMSGNALIRQGKALSAEDQAVYNRAKEIVQGKK